MNFQDAINNARGIGVMNGAQIEQERANEINKDANYCDCDARLIYSPSVGAWRSPCGAMYTSSGATVRPCTA